MATDQNGVYRFSLLLISFVLVIYLLKEFSALFLPLVVALLLFLLVEDFVNKLAKKRIPRGLAVVFVVLLIFMLFYLTGLIFYGGIATVVDKFPFYSSQINKQLVGLADMINIPITDVEKYIKSINWSEVFNMERIGGYLSSILGSFTGFLSNLVLILLFLLFLLLPEKSFFSLAHAGLPLSDARRFITIVDNIKGKTQKYLLIKTAISLLTALVAAMILTVMGSDFVIFFATLVFVLNFIPTIGSLISTIFPVVFMFFKFGFGWRFVLLTVGLMSTQFIIGNILEPQVSGKMLKLSPLTILLALIFWGGIWSITGMFLAVPLTVALVIVLENFPAARVLVRVLKGE